jgi:hypothetical protein
VEEYLVFEDIFGGFGLEREVSKFYHLAIIVIGLDITIYCLFESCKPLVYFVFNLVVDMFVGCSWII